MLITSPFLPPFLHPPPPPSSLHIEDVECHCVNKKRTPPNSHLCSVNSCLTYFSETKFFTALFRGNPSNSPKQTRARCHSRPMFFLLRCSIRMRAIMHPSILIKSFHHSFIPSFFQSSGKTVDRLRVPGGLCQKISANASIN